MWSTTDSNFNTLYSSFLSIYLSPTSQYYCGANCGIVCASNVTIATPFTALTGATGVVRSTVNCSQTLNNTRFVTVHKPVMTPTASYDRIYLYEMRVVRAGGSTHTPPAPRVT